MSRATCTKPAYTATRARGLPERFFRTPQAPRRARSRSSARMARAVDTVPNARERT
jgi:hypothetical protein